MGQVVSLAQNLVTLTCWAREGCGIQFAVPQRFDQACREHGSTFYCPRGHRLHYGEGEVARLIRERDAERKKKEWAEQDAKRARERADTARHAEKIAKGKLKAHAERVKKGVCPCCKRSFQNLKRHMDTKHPNWDGEEPNESRSKNSR